MASCIVCGVVPEPVEKDYPHQPYRATLFHTSGHYGSTVFDTMMDRRLELVVCDPCLLERADRIVHLTPNHAPKPPPTRKVWNPEQDYR